MIPIDYMRAETPDGWHVLRRDSRGVWQFDDISVEDRHGRISLRATQPILRLQIGWYAAFPENASFMGDSFERGYGDMGFTRMRPDKVFHWYFCVSRRHGIVSCWGVKTNPNAWCAWTASPNAIDLWLDVRNGDAPLSLQGSDLHVCDILIQDYSSDSYSAVMSHCRLMASECHLHEDTPPIVGCNDWYYAYGSNSPDLEYRTAAFLTKIWPKNLNYRPWVIIDDGWQRNRTPVYNGGPWDKANDVFHDMHEVAKRLKDSGVRPGIWFRPLLAEKATTPPEYILRDNADGSVVLDPSHPAVQQQVQTDVERLVSWGFELIKHDFTTYDILGCWGKDLTMRYQAMPLSFYDKTKTTAQIIKTLYDIIGKAAGTALTIGCNTISHLSAGVFDLMRIGDDTSGRNFNRTRRMGVNSLAFRMPQHRSFYLCDADCIGITNTIDWQNNREWLRLLAMSDTPLFISCDPERLNEEQVEDIRRAVDQAVNHHGSAHPQGWESNIYPEEWIRGVEYARFNWYPTPRAIPILD